MDSLEVRLSRLLALDHASATERRARGQEFEELLVALLSRGSLDPRMRYRPDGEEIDGSFLLDQRAFLLEAKWYTDPLPASSIYAFRGKVDGKLHGTLGIFVSMSGFSKDAVDALAWGKVLNVLLFDREDIIDACADPVDGRFERILREKLRAAAEEGNVYLTRTAARLRMSPPRFTRTSRQHRSVIVVCEGGRDAEFLGAIIRRLRTGVNVTLVPAGGKLATSPVVNSMSQGGAPDLRFVVVVDSDGDPYGSSQAVASRLTDPARVKVVVPHPKLESWVGPTFAGTFSGRSKAEIEDLANKIDLEDLAQSDVSFERFKAALEWALLGT